MREKHAVGSILYLLLLHNPTQRVGIGNLRLHFVPDTRGQFYRVEGREGNALLVGEVFANIC